MRIVRLMVVIGVALAATACGGDEQDATDPTEPASTTSEASSSSGPPPTTVEARTTEQAGTTTTSTAPPTATTTTSRPSTSQPTTTTSTELEMVDVKAYLTHGERLAISHRSVAGPAVLRAALTDLLEGPTADERDAGFATALADGTTLLDLNLTDGTATVDLSDEFEQGGGSLLMSARVAQLVFTTTQFDNVDDVMFWIEGEPVVFLGGEGIDLSEPQTRSSTDRSLTGGVLIDQPRPGATVTSPFVITGEGDVFEGDFPIRFRRGGVDVAGPFVVRAGAWGDWEEFETTIELDLAPGPIELVTSDGHGCETPDCTPTEIVVPLILD